jgi:hypothetical protein
MKARARVSVRDEVVNEKAFLKSARKMVLALFPQDPRLLQEFLKEKFRSRPIQNADCFEMAGFPQFRQQFSLVKTIPNVPVQVTDDTENIIQSQSWVKKNYQKKYDLSRFLSLDSMQVDQVWDFLRVLFYRSHI